MNLPLVLDIALGLLFIFLIFSLLASEVQELIATLLQWRAEHLKKSIEILITGENVDEIPGIAFADQLYQNPLIRSLNQEAKGPIARLFRTITQRIGESYRFITRTRNVFGTLRSGPSYIPSASFAAALLENLNIQAIAYQKSRETLEGYITEKLNLVGKLSESLKQDAPETYYLLREEFGYLEQRLKEVLTDFDARRATFTGAMDRAMQQFMQFLDSADETLANDAACSREICCRLPYLRQSVATRRLEPTVAEVVDAVLKQQDQIPDQLKRNLISLAEEVQIKSNLLSTGVRDLESKIESWFDRSMDRASGVYKRNARGIALIIGFIIATSTNTDTIYIVSRLSKDSVLRTTIGQAAEQLTLANRTIVLQEATAADGSEMDEAAQLQVIRDAVNSALDGLPLPIGWSETIVAQQQLQAEGWQFPILRRIIGWFITGIALSMGASFWYNLIGKIIRVRNTGGTTD
ncbi:MAG: hypothetical protein VKK04_23385 [Synechococcales bacterium]|nr:hypothetical protein [Synechococcales bacterium]